MNESIDRAQATARAERALRSWLEQGPERGPDAGLERALAATRRVPQRPGWTFPERWIPVQLTLARAYVPRPLLYAVVATLLAFAAIGAALFVGSQLNRTAPPFGPAANGLIAYAEGRTIFVANLDGSAPVAISQPGAFVSGPAFSRDGSRIAFWSRPSAQAPIELIVARPDGSEPVNVISDAGLGKVASIPPAWSPDGSSLVFVAEQDRAFRLVVASSNGAATKVLATSDTEIGYPAWSPDAKLITFREIAPPKVSIVGIAPDGTGRRTLVAVEVAPEQASDMGLMHRLMQWFEWSPNGDRLAYTAFAYIATVDLAGNVVKLDAEPGDTAEFNPAWSPDGSRLAFIGSNGESLVVANADGSSYRTVGRNLVCTTPLAWSPDGSLILGGAPGSSCSADQVGAMVAVDVETGRTVELEGVANGVPTWQRLPITR